MGVPTIDGYDALEPIGEGAGGRVFRANESGLDRTVAVKVLKQITSIPNGVERFDREARALGRLADHPAVVTVYRHGRTDDGDPYLAMELMASDLAAEIPMPESAAVDAIRTVGDGLETAHRHGILHRDIKPANLFRDRHGRVRIGDFGLATSATAESLTQGNILGSPAYMAPELIHGREPTDAADVYALAATLYELIEGVVPFTADNVPALLHAAVNAPPRPPSRMSSGVWAAVACALAKDPALRPVSVRAFLDVLDGTDDAAPGAAASETAGLPLEQIVPTDGPTAPSGPAAPPAPTAPPAPAATRRRVVPIVVAIVAVALAVWAGIALLGGDDGEPDPDDDGPGSSGTETTESTGSTEPPETTTTTTLPDGFVSVTASEDSVLLGLPRDWSNPQEFAEFQDVWTGPEGELFASGIEALTLPLDESRDLLWQEWDPSCAPDGPAEPFAADDDRTGTVVTFTCDAVGDRGLAAVIDSGEGHVRVRIIDNAEPPLALAREILSTVRYAF